MKKFLTRWDGLLVLIFSGLVVVFLSGLGGQLLVGNYLRNADEREIALLSEQLLRRVELSADYAVIALGDLVTDGPVSCSADDQSKLQEFVASKAAVKGILIVDDKGNVTCSGSAGVADKLAAGFLANPSYPTRNSAMSLKAVGDGNGMFALLWRISPDQSYLITFNIDSLVFDVFPAKWREQGVAEISLGSKSVIARFAPDDPIPAATKQYDAKSSRYPINVSLRVAVDGFARWNSIAAAPGGVVGALFGLSIAALVFVVFNRRYGAAVSLQRAIRNGEIQPFFQPVFALSTRNIVGCEVLVRWMKNDRIKLAPDRFIPQAEADGSIVQMTEHLIDDSLSKLGGILKGDPGFNVAFNISPAHFQAAGFVEDLLSRARTYGVASEQIVLELTERQSFDDVGIARAAVVKAQAAGFKIALDDTGVGHNGLANVQELGTDIIKIDKKFVDLVGVDDAATAIVVMLVGLARRLGMTTVAEGLEHEAQLEELVRCGVDEGQGYLVSRAVPIEDFRTLIARGSPTRSALKVSASSESKTFEAH